METDEQNFAALVDSEAGQIMLAEDLLRRALMANQAGERFIQFPPPSVSASSRASTGAAGRP